MIPQIKEINFPEYATLSQASVTLNDMGSRIITTQIHIHGDVKPDFSYNWEVAFNGEKYIHPLHSPQALKDTSSVASKIDLTFYHWLEYELKRYFFVTIATINTGWVIADKYIASLNLDIYDFVKAFQDVLDYYYKGAIKVELNPDREYSREKVNINISYTKIWDVLQQFYEIFGVRWSSSGNTIKVGYPTSEISHVFEYGYEKGLLSIERQVQDPSICNQLLGRGGSQNLPKYYFKNAPKDSLYASDPDAIPELENVFFSELRGKTFRDYVKGWKVAHYGGEPMENPTEAYQKGLTDSGFDPIEYVKDDDSIAKYGVIQDGLENNEGIYPSIQNITLDTIGLVNEIVAVEPVLSDDIDSSAVEQSIISSVESKSMTDVVNNTETKVLTVPLNFEVEEGYQASLFFETKTTHHAIVTDVYGGSQNISETDYCKFGKVEAILQNALNGEEVDSFINIPSGIYFFRIECEVANTYEDDYLFSKLFIYATLELSNLKIVKSRFTEGGEEWKPTFDVWIKNIWQTEKLSTETEQEYADRVWLPILGIDGQEAMVTFSSGWLSSSSDWDFKIVKGGYAYDTSKSYNGVPSHWRLTLEKSDAEIKATDKYIPNIGMQAVAGDTFFFTGIDMQHQYVLFAEQRVDEWKNDNLFKTSDIQPKWVAKFDKLRINTLEEGDKELLFNQISIGSSIRIGDKRFIDKPYIETYIQSITYNFSDKMFPEIDVVLSNEVAVVKNPVTKIQDEISILSRQIGSLSNIQQIVRQIGDALYLRKDGIEDYSNSPTQFNSIVKGVNFRPGAVGGSGWGIYKDGNGNTIAEFDKLIARKDFEVNNFIVNQVSYVGGLQINSAAAIECSNVEELENGYKCYFDQKQGSVVNLFKVDDVAYCQSYFLENNILKSYKRRVIEVGVNYILLSKTDKNGDGIPSAKDNIIHFGNYTDKERQYVIIRDVVGGGYERMLSDLDSVDATGVEYYFAGRMNNGKPRWFVGDKDGEYAEWVDGKLKIKGSLEVGSDVGGATVVDGGLVTAETISLGSEGNIKAGTTGTGDSDEDIRFWAGSTFEDRANAPFRVLQSGKSIMQSGVFGGFIQTNLINVEELNTTSQTYGQIAVRLDKYFNVIVFSPIEYEIILPNGVEFVGVRVFIVNNHVPPYTRTYGSGPIPTYIRAESVREGQSEYQGYISGWEFNLNIEDYTNIPSIDCISIVGGVCELLCVGRGKWHIVSINTLHKEIIH